MTESTVTRAFCTYFDSAYAARGAAMIESLRMHGENGPVFVLALDDDAQMMLEASRLTGLTFVSPAQLESAFPGLLSARLDRSAMEYVFTLTPWLVRFTQSTTHAEWTVYLDADLGFFSSCDPVFSEMEGGSVGIVPHRFPSDQEWRLKFGTYNVGWVGFRNDADGTACLQWWSESCREWCRETVDQGRFADQGYLDQFSSIGNGVVAVSNPGVDLAPWNLPRHRLEWDGSAVQVDGHPLVFFHFHGLRRHGNRYYFKHLPYRARTSALIRNRIYGPYCRALDYWNDALPEPRVTAALARQPTIASPIRLGRELILRLAARLRGDTLRPRQVHQAWSPGL